MTHRLKADKKTMNLDAIRDMAEDIAIKSHDILSRAKARLKQRNLFTASLEDTWTSKRARVISVISYAVAVSVGAIILGIYYMYVYHPNTETLFKHKH